VRPKKSIIIIIILSLHGRLTSEGIYVTYSTQNFLIKVFNFFQVNSNKAPSTDGRFRNEMFKIPLAYVKNYEKSLHQTKLLLLSANVASHDSMTSLVAPDTGKIIKNGSRVFARGETLL